MRKDVECAFGILKATQRIQIMSIITFVAAIAILALSISQTSAFRSSYGRSLPARDLMAVFDNYDSFSSSLLPSRYKGGSSSSFPVSGSIIKAFLDEETWAPRVYSISSQRALNRSPNFNIDYVQKANGDIEITADMPGFDKEDVEIEVLQGNQLKISVSREEAKEEASVASEEKEKALSGNEEETVIDLDAVDTTAEAKDTPHRKVADSPAQTIYRERTSFSGSRTIQLPKDIDETKVSASLSKGVLTVTIPHLPAKTPQRRLIEISS
jgi:HSP20 family protein